MIEIAAMEDHPARKRIERRASWRVGRMSAAESSPGHATVSGSV
jgi:hypothetical protein